MEQQEKLVAELYNGDIKVEFNPANHCYTVNGKRAGASVTAITGIVDKSTPLKYWVANLIAEFLHDIKKAGRAITKKNIEEARALHTKTSDEAKSKGQIVHDYAEQFAIAQIAGLEAPEIPEDDEQVANGILAFLKWTDQKQVKFLDAEKIVYSKEHDYIGLMDVKFTMGAEEHKIIHAGDYKTGSPRKNKRMRDKKPVYFLDPYPEHRYQVSAYQEADAEESGTEYGNKWIMYFDKENGDFHAFECEEHEDDLLTFYACKRVLMRGKELNKQISEAIKNKTAKLYEPNK